MTDDGIVSRFVCVVVNPRWRKERVRYVWGGPVGTGKMHWDFQILYKHAQFELTLVSESDDIKWPKTPIE